MFLNKKKENKKKGREQIEQEESEEKSIDFTLGLYANVKFLCCIGR